VLLGRQAAYVEKGSANDRFSPIVFSNGSMGSGSF
jgi:hypothetical protein